MNINIINGDNKSKNNLNGLSNLEKKLYKEKANLEYSSSHFFIFDNIDYTKSFLSRNFVIFRLAKKIA